MELRKINENDIEAQWAYTTSLPVDENGLTNPYNGVSFEEYLLGNSLISISMLGRRNQKGAEGEVHL